MKGRKVQRTNASEKIQIKTRTPRILRGLMRLRKKTVKGRKTQRKGLGRFRAGERKALAKKTRRDRKPTKKMSRDFHFAWRGIQKEFK